MNSVPSILTPYELNSNKAPAFWEVDILWLILADSAQTGGSLTMLEQICPRNSGPPPHTHSQQESYYILEGQMTVLVDGRKLVATQGSFVNVPPNAVHSFRIDSETARILNMYTPAGFERLITELGEPAPERVLPPPGRPMKAASDAMQALLKEIGMVWLDLPDTLREEIQPELKHQ